MSIAMFLMASSLLLQFQPPPPSPLGWSWVVEPLSVDQFVNGIHALTPGTTVGATRNQDGGITVFLTTADSMTPFSDVPRYRFVFLDKNLNRIVDDTVRPPSDRTFVGPTIQTYRFTAPSISSDVDRIGIEKIDAEGRTKIFLDATSKGIELLPPLGKGKDFPFRLTAIDGKVLDSSSMKGDRVYFYSWGADGDGVQRKNNEVAEFITRQAIDPSRVIGLCFAASIDIAKRDVTDFGVNWPVVYIPADAATIELWMQMTNWRMPEGIIEKDGTLLGPGNWERLLKYEKENANR